MPYPSSAATTSLDGSALLHDSKQRLQILEILAEDFGFSLDESPSSPHVGSRSSSPHVGSRSSSPLQAGDDGPALTSTLQLLYNVCSASSDVLFAFPSLLPAFASGSAPGDDVRLVELEMRRDAAHVITGAAAGQTAHGRLPRLSVLAPSAALDVLAPALFELAREQVSCTVHVSSGALQADGQHCSDHGAVMRTRHCGALLLASGSLPEAHDVAVLASYLSAQLRHPAVHFFDALSVGAQASTLVAASDSARQRQRSFLSAAAEDHADVDGHCLANGGVPLIEELMDECAAALLSGRSYRAVDYHGSSSATSVLVMAAATAAPAVVAAVKRLSRSEGHAIGVVVVRLLRPWPAEQLLRAVPATCRRLLVVDVDADGALPLYQDVAVAVNTLGRRHRLLAGAALASANVAALCRNNAGAAVAERLCQFALDPSTAALRRFDAQLQCRAAAPSKRPISVWRRQQPAGKDDAGEALVVYSDVGVELGTVAAQRDRHVAALAYTDSYSCRLPVAVHHVLVGGRSAAAAALHSAAPVPDGGASVVAVVGAVAADVLRFLDVVRHLRPDGALLVAGMAAKTLRPLLTPALVEQLQHKRVRLYCTADVAAHCALSAALQAVDALPPLRYTAAKSPPTDLVCHSARLAPCSRLLLADSASAPPSLHSRLCAALVWPQSVPSEQRCATAEHSGGAFVLRVAGSERLTPLSYDRNVFHLELERPDGAPLRYAVGDALGIAPHNDADEVAAFLRWYNGGADAQRLVDVPDVGVCTLLQAFTQCLDLYGKPSPAFYRRLAELASDAEQRRALAELVGGDDGGAALRRRVDETLTYADALREFDSARPTVDELLTLVAPIKMRVYSIASSNNAHPTQVQLLVVVHDWTTPAGRRRVGTSTRYLSSLRVGDTVVAAFKPSAMVLPPDHRQPVIMAGLGTGMAPFRAFIEERAYQRSRGVDVGPMLLYFGSRHRRMEYLYGDELEAYAAAGVLTRLQLAFSRDQPDKIYIQHKLHHDAALIGQLITAADAHFYLCGPTWPVPDVEAALAAAVRQAQPQRQLSDHDVRQFFDQLKDQHRYVLEVY